MDMRLSNKEKKMQMSVYEHPHFANYQPRQPQWEKHAAVRSRPRRFLSDEENPGDFYPPSRQPLIVHPLLKDLDNDKRQFVLIQSLYKYMNDIANIEKDIINQVCYKITKDEYFIPFSNEMKHDALSIIIDESYHAYVAIDFMEQVAAYTGVKSLPLPNNTELSDAIADLGNSLEGDTRKNFEFIAVCIAEHALTNDLIVIAKSKDVCKTFYYVMHDHVLDEGRHAKYFATMLDILWSFLPEEQKVIIGPLLPELLTRYFRPNLQRSFDKSILESIGIDKTKIETILNDTHPPTTLQNQKESNIVVRQMLELLSKTHVIEHEPTQSAFTAYGLH